MSMYMNGRYFKITHPPRSFFVEGNPVTFKTKYKLPIKSLKVNFNPVQDLHGYDAPWPAGGGKNLLDMSEENIVLGQYINDAGNVRTDTKNFYNSKFISVLPNTSYTLSVSSPVAYCSFMEYDINKQFLKRTLVGNTRIMTTSNTITTLNDTAYVLIGSNVENKTITLSDVISIQWQVEQASAPTDFAPYSNICPINGWTGITISHSSTDTTEIFTVPISWENEIGIIYSGHLEWTKDSNIKLVIDQVKKTITAFTGTFGTTSNGYAVYVYVADSARDKTWRTNYKCNMFSASNTSYRNMPLYSYMGGSGANTTWTFILPSTITTLQEANAWLAALSEPVEFTYALPTPQTYTLTSQEALTLLQGTNTIWSDTNGNLEVTYESYTNEQ